MFGQKNDQGQQADNQFGGQPQSDITDPDIEQPSGSPHPSPSQDWQHPGMPTPSSPQLTIQPLGGVNDTPLSPASDGDATTPAPSTSPTLDPSWDSSLENTPPVEDIVQTTQTDSESASSTGTHDLIDIKQQALSQLSPLVGHLNQEPEEKFRTTMMMIQASDDQSLIPDAYEAAGKISDEKARAQALLDIVNEINYFTQHHKANSED